MKLNKLRFSSNLWQIFRIGSLTYCVTFSTHFSVGFLNSLPIPKMLMCGVHKSMGCLLKKNSRHLKTNINKKKTNRILSGMKKKSNFVDPQMAVIFWSAELAYLANWRFTKKCPNGETQHLFFRCAMQHKFKLWNFFQNVRM